DVLAVIFDNGSGLSNVAIAGDSGPRSVFTAIVGHSKVKATMLGAGQKECYIGGEGQSKRGVLSLNHLIDRVIVTCWDDMERIWRHIYDYELRMKASERPVLLTEALLSPLQKWEKVTVLMFQGFVVPAVYIAVQAILTLSASAHITGIVMDSWDGVTHTVPIYEGYCLPHAVSRLDVAGRDITEYLMKLLLESGHTFVSTTEREIVRDIKENLCYVASDPIQEMIAKPEEIMKEYRLRDNNIIQIGNQLFHAPETLFVPANIGVEPPAVHKIIFNSIMKCDFDMRRNLYGNILLSDFKERLLKELQTGVPNTTRVKIISPQDQRYSMWVGASILASLRMFRNMWVTRDDYNEVGPTVLQRKCF
ncbi:Actin-1, partial [Cariama cristata]